MEDDETVSVSKGVFLFKNGFKAPTKRNKKVSNRNNNENRLFSNNLWYKSYSNLWQRLEEDIEELNNNMFSSVLYSLVAHVQQSYTEKVDEIPTAALLTGINMPDHGAQFKTLSNQIKKEVSPHVAVLYSQDCQNLKSFMENMMNQFVNDGFVGLDNDEEILESSGRKFIKKSLLNFSFLQSWYEEMYNQNKSKINPLVVIVPDFESFNAKILQDFILIASSYLNILPFVLIFGIATSISTLHSSFPYKVSSKINIEIFHSQPSTIYLNNVLENVFFALDCPFQLGGKVFNLFTDIFLFYDLSVTGFIKNIKYAMLEHFCYGNAMALCNFDKKAVRQVLNAFSHEDCENVRQLLSFRKLVEKESYENRIKLLTNDEYFKYVIEEEIIKLKKYIRRLHLFIRCLHILVCDLPKAPLGKQTREVYAIATSKNITQSKEYKDCFQLLDFQSKIDLSSKLTNIAELIAEMVNESYKKRNKLVDFLEQLNNFRNLLEVLDMENVEVEDMEIEPESSEVISGQKLGRQQLKEKLLGMSKQTKPLNKYEKLRKSILEFLNVIFQEYLVEPTVFNFHEIFFFNDISIQNQIIGTHRAAIHNALNDPQYYLQCKCCEIPNDSVIKRTMPDICIAYKLHLECGRMINLYDWLQAFLIIVDPVADEDEDATKKVVNPELQARFTQAVAELEFLGFIKSSKRKADHVTRLTWGG